MCLSLYSFIKTINRQNSCFPFCTDATLVFYIKHRINCFSSVFVNGTIFKNSVPLCNRRLLHFNIATKQLISRYLQSSTKLYDFIGIRTADTFPPTKKLHPKKLPRSSPIRRIRCSPIFGRSASSQYRSAENYPPKDHPRGLPRR